MALFGKLFDKKQCSICGGDIGLLGNRKLEDGNCCKNCAAKLSPWFSERRQSTVEDIKAQLEYRETNQEKVAAFHATRHLGREHQSDSGRGCRDLPGHLCPELAERQPRCAGLFRCDRLHIGH